MCGVGAVQLMTGRAEWGVWVVLTGRWGCLRWVQLLGAGLSCGGCFCSCGCKRGGFDLEIGSDGFFDHTGAVESCRLGAGLPVLGSAMAVKPLALIWDLAQIDILTIRVLKCDIF